MRGPVVLIGMMGSGKTSVGRALAGLLSLRWTDLDREMVRRFGRSVAGQFKCDGEEVFRRRERELLREYCRRGPAVLSTGGGVVLCKENQELLKRHCTIFLSAAPQVLAERIKASRVGERPLLVGREADPENLLRGVAGRRNPLYRSCATMTVLASHGSPQQIASRIERRLRTGIDSLK